MRRELPGTFVTDRATFTEAVADKNYRCSANCGKPIKKGTQMFTKPFMYRRTQTGLTRLHNLEDCWMEWDDHVISTRLMAKDIFDDEQEATQ